jgi:hypothetical protein
VFQRWSPVAKLITRKSEVYISFEGRLLLTAAPNIRIAGIPALTELDISPHLGSPLGIADPSI